MCSSDLPPVEPLPAPTPSPSTRTPLDRLDINNEWRKRLLEGGIADVEAILTSSLAKLTQILGDAQAATNLQELAKALLKTESSHQGL